jgi:hypothetical protein
VSRVVVVSFLSCVLLFVQEEISTEFNRPLFGSFSSFYPTFVCSFTPPDRLL